MIVYLWTANGRLSGERGVSGSRAMAQEAAEACLKPGRASTAQVESALVGRPTWTSPQTTPVLSTTLPRLWTRAALTRQGFTTHT